MKPIPIPAAFSVKHLKNVHIPMSDGIYLASDILMPLGEGPFPAILEAYPYRKDDLMVDATSYHHYLAERGFVGVRVDLRGTGSSQGVALDEYTPQEQKDLCETIAWLSRQPWSNGNVGMWGTSYGGFNTIQTAMLNPPALKAIAPHAATDDRYHDDVHYYGGCLTGLDLLIYPLWMISENAMPPHPDIATDDYASMWQQRLMSNPPWILEWLRHQTEDEYWHQGSLKVDYGSIQCPVFQIGGWADGYTNATMRMMQNLKVPNKAIIGPWNHGRPSHGYPGPNLNELQELYRWWAYWLRNEETGIMDEPPVALYIQAGAPPDPFLSHMPGHWRWLDSWPPDGLQERSFYLASNERLDSQPEPGIEADGYRYQATVGLAGGFWCPISPPYGLSGDQSIDESRSLVYTSQPFQSALEILGFPKAVIHASSNTDITYFVVKLSDVSPDGSSRLVSRGLINATHRNSHTNPEPLNPGEKYELEIQLKAVSWTFQAGHRLRVAISCSDFPTIWPSPKPATNTIFRGSIRPSRIILPVVEHVVSASNEIAYLEPVALKPMANHQGELPTWKINRDMMDGTTTVILNTSGKVQPLGESYSVSSETYTEMATSDERPDQTYIKGFSRASIIQKHAQTDIVGRAVIRSTVENLHVDIELRVDIDKEPFFQRHWIDTIPRNLV